MAFDSLQPGQNRALILSLLSLRVWRFHPDVRPSKERGKMEKGKKKKKEHDEETLQILAVDPILPR